MTAQEALARIRRDMEKAAADTPAVQKLIGKINSGTATLSDTELYAHWAAVQLGVALSDAVCQIDLSDRAAVCKALMLDQYEDINGFVDQVQRELDDRFGIRIAPQRAPFPEERVDQIAHSLQDASKPDDVIQRRARSTATVTRSFHDDRMRSEARFRSEAGIKCYIVREGSGCCPWCSEMVGRYEYGDEPDDVFRRHDNCTCSVTYECGRKRQDVWSKREWEAPEPGAGAGERVVLTEEQARELEEKHLPEVLTNGAASGTIEERYRIGQPVPLIEKTYDMMLDRETYIEAVVKKYHIHLRGSGRRITIVIDDTLPSAGKSCKDEPNIIRLGPSAFYDEVQLANTIAHELNHCRSWLKGGNAPENPAYHAGDTLELFIRGEL